MSISGGGLTVSGTFTGSSPVTFYVEIDAEGTPDTFKWRDVQSSYNATGVSCSNSPISLSYGLTIAFASTNGNSDGESWSWTSEPMSLSNTKDGVLLSKEGIHNLVAVGDGKINRIDQITSPDGITSDYNRATSLESAMTVHNKEAHIGHGALPTTWAGYIKNTQWGEKFEDFHVTDGAVAGISSLAFLDYLVSDGTYLWGARYRGNELYRVLIADPYTVTINRTDYKEICGITYAASGLYVLNCDSEETDNYSLYEVTSATMAILYRHNLTGIDFDDVDNVIFSDIITTNAKVWYAAYSPDVISKEIVLWNSPIPDNDDADLALTNRSPGILKGATDGNGKATEGWMDLEFHSTSTDVDNGQTSALPVDVEYTRTYKRSLINTEGAAVVGWLCRYKPHTAGIDGDYGEELYTVHTNVFYISAGDKWTHFGEDPKIINAVTEAHVAGNYASNTAHLYPVLFPLGDNPSMLYSSNTNALYVCDNTKKIVRYLTSSVDFSTITSKAYTNSLETGTETTTAVSSLVLGATTENAGVSDLLYAIKREDYPAIDHITFTLSGSAWSSYVEDFSSSTPLVLTFTRNNDNADKRGDDASILDDSGGITSGDDTIGIDDISIFAYSGTVIIDPTGDKELVTYTGKNIEDSTLTGCKRGRFGTTAAAHDDGKTIVQARAKYFWKVSYTYDGYQESPLVSFLSPTSGAVDGAPNIDVKLTHSSISSLNKRITHINLYRADNTDLSKSEPEGFFRLVKSIPLSDGGWDINSSTDVAEYTVEDIGPATVAYDARTGISEVVPSTSINYGLSTEINSTLIIGRGNLEEIDNADQYLFKSKVHNYDIFDWTEDLLKLPRVPTALASFSGRIYAFDENNTYRINPSGFYIEDMFEGVGCIGPKAVITTEFGMFFCDDTNIYLHNGTNAAPIGDSIARGDDNYAWQNRDTSFVPIVGFEPKRGSFLVFFKPTGVDGYFVWAYNLARKRWDLWEFHDTYVPQCVIAGPNGEVYVATDNSIVHYLAGSGWRTWEYQTKEITLGADTQDKRFYKIKKIGTAAITYGVNDSIPTQTLTDEKLQTAHKKSKSIKIKATSQVGEVDSLGIVYRRLSVK